MIIGIGVDLVDCRRIEKIYLKFRESFLKKIYTQKEQQFFLQRNKNIATLAKIFALKEGVAKAISDITDISWLDIEVLHDKNGKPFVELHKKALERAVMRANGKDFCFEVSVSDELPYVCGFVIFMT